MGVDDIRQLNINLNHWYVVARSADVQQQSLGVTVWHQPIVLYRDRNHQIYALEDRCPHRQVRLSYGQVIGNRLQCAYHGWCFDAAGYCVSVPSLTDDQKLPTCKLQTYPVKEQDGFIWLFPGDANKAETVKIFSLPEWNHIDYIATVSTIECAAHYSYVIENVVDLYHDHLHEQYQVWREPVLQEIHEADDRVDVRYDGQICYQIDNLWSISQLFIPAFRRFHSILFQMSYVYPHWMQALGEDFKLYCLLCPINKTATRAYLVHFTSLKHLQRVQRLPISIRWFINKKSFNIAQSYLDKLVHQDVQMMEEEQQAYLQYPEQRNYEFNPAIASVQRLMRNQVLQTIPELETL